MEILGIPVIPRKNVWVAVLGPEFTIHFREVAGKWFGKRTTAQEDYATGDTLRQCAVRCIQRYAKFEEECRLRAKTRLASLG